MKIYSNTFPEEFYQSIEVEGKYAVEISNGNYYRFIYPPYKFAIDVENFLLGIGIEHQCDKMFVNKRLAGIPTTYKQFADDNYSVFIYFINDNYKGGELLYEDQVINPLQNKGVYFENNDKFALTDVTEGTQYLLVSYFRKNPIKQSRTLL
jgi:hypothetical protein